MNTHSQFALKWLAARFDSSLLKGSAIITLGVVLARGLGFAVTLMQSRSFNPESFGVIQYAVSVAGIIAVGMQPLGQHILARYLGLYEFDKAQQLEMMSNIFAIMLVILIISLLIATPFLLAKEKYTFGILTIFLGTSVFYTYWGLARGYLSALRLMGLEIGNNLMQIVLIYWLIMVIGIKSSMLAMLIQGLACFIPIVIIQLFWPLPLNFDRKLVNKKSIANILKFSTPVWISHTSYMFYMTVAILFLKHYADNVTVGIYSLSITLSVIFSFLPTGFSTFLLPVIASASAARRKVLVANALTIATLTNLAFLAIYFFSVRGLVTWLFGPAYLATPGVFSITAIAMTLVGIHSILTSALVGQGNPQVETKSRILIMIATIIICWMLIPGWGILGAAISNLGGIVCGLLVYAWYYIVDERKSRAACANRNYAKHQEDFGNEME